jgi:hypothetical protein
MLAVEYLRVCCEHTDGRTVKDREALTKGMSLGIRVNWKYKNQIPDYQRETFWDDLTALPSTLERDYKLAQDRVKQWRHRTNSEGTP